MRTTERQPALPGGLDPLVAMGLAAEASRSLVRLGLVRGASRHTKRRIAQAAALLVAATALLAPDQAHAMTPVFRITGRTPSFFMPWTNPFGLASVGYYASPTFADIDGDGDLDAFVGEEYGNTVFFENTGSASAPAFAAPSTNPFGLADVGNNSSPAFADLDGDGDLDAVVGEENGNTVFFENTGSASAPAFEAPFTNPFGLADVGSRSTPTFADIDGDGDVDAFVGRTDGSTIFFRNTGSAAAPAFAAPSTNPFGLAFALAGEARPAFADLDEDGDLDAFVGADDGDTVFSENTGSASAPAFAAPSTNPFGLANVGNTSSPAFADLDGDGDLDAFVGERWYGNVVHFRNDGWIDNPFGLNLLAPEFADIDADGDLDAFTGAAGGDTVFARNTGSATAPAFAAPSTNPFGLAAVTGLASFPAFADLDADGDLDAMVADYFGNLAYFRNTGSAAAAAFAAPSTNPFGLTATGFGNVPAFADIDNDGDVDAFVGQADGNTIFFRNTGSAAAPAFAAPSTNPFGLADVGNNSSPAFADLDEDGDLDAMIGRDDGNTLFFRNTGSAAAPAFAAPSTNPFGIASIKNVPYGSATAHPTFADLDGDDDLDAFIGGGSGVGAYFRNDGGCPPTPLAGCTTPGKALLKLQANADPGKRKLLWKWLKGTASKEDFGDPATGANGLALCVYKDGVRIMRLLIDGGTGWDETAPGFRYKDTATNADGVFVALVKEGTGTAKALVKAKGANLTLPALPLTPTTGVRAQLVKDDGDPTPCWEASFTAPYTRDDSTLFKDKEP